MAEGCIHGLACFVPHASSFSPRPSVLEWKTQLTTESFSTTVTITNPAGLHLRTSKDVVQAANQFDATIRAQNLTRQSAFVDVKSILQLMQLQARYGHILLLHAEGPDAQTALNTLCALLTTLS